METNKRELLSSIAYSNGFEILGENYGGNYNDLIASSVSSVGDLMVMELRA